MSIRKPPPASPTAADEVAGALRRAYPVALAGLLRVTRSLDAAEDALHDAVVAALVSWPRDGFPTSPVAWLVKAGRNRHIDRARRARGAQRHGDTLRLLAEPQPWSSELLAPSPATGWNDDMLRLLFTCCHPLLGGQERVALCLNAVVGMSCNEIARAFLVAPRTMEQRLVRARRRIRERAGDYRVPEVAVVPERLDPALGVIHLLYNEAYWSADDEEPIRAELLGLSLQLARSLHALLPKHPECAALVCIVEFGQARLPARMTKNGPVALPEQDRALWDGPAIERARSALEVALARGQPGRYQIEAAIACLHCSAARAQDTDWAQIAALYEALEQFRSGPVVRINRAFAHGMAHGARPGLELLETIEEGPGVSDYPYLHLVRGALLAMLGDLQTADAEYARAEALAVNRHERAQIARRRADLRLDPATRAVGEHSPAKTSPALRD